MMAYSEDHIALAAEYALGTSTAEERSEVETLMAADADYAQVVDAWVRQLAVLNQMVVAVEPREEVWERIKAAVVADPQLQAALPLMPDDMPSDASDLIGAAETVSEPVSSPISSTAEADPVVANVVPEPASVVAEAAPVIEPVPVMQHEPDPAPVTASQASNVIDFSPQVRRWRRIATATSAIAAVLVAFIAVQTYRPDLLPAGARSKVVPQMAQTPAAVQTASVATAQYVALLQKDPASPAFILTVDAGTKNFTVRKVNAANEPGRSYELWIVSDKLQKPRSLGVIGSHDFTIRPDLASYAPDMVNQATYAVTNEPEGGSPTGQATGPIVFTGKLIETVPQVK